MNLTPVELVLCGTLLITITAESYGMIINNGAEQVSLILL